MHFTRLLCYKIPLRAMVRPVSHSTHVGLTPKPVASRLIAVLASWLPILQDSLHILNDSKPLGMCVQPGVACAEHDLQTLLQNLQFYNLLCRPFQYYKV